MAVGDLINVKLTIAGLEDSQNYLIISDELPSGMIAINDSFSNQSYDSGENRGSDFDFTDRRGNHIDNKEITENGVNIYLSNTLSGSQTYTYQARAVNAGTFVVPPATASLMYEPDISARSDTQPITIAMDPIEGPSKIPVSTTVAPTAEEHYRFTRQSDSQTPLLKVLGKELFMLDLIMFLRHIPLFIVLIFIIKSVIGYIYRKFSSQYENHKDTSPPQPPQAT